MLDIMKYLDVLVLVGGKGERLKSVTGGLPKPLVPVRGRPFVTYLLDHLSSFGVSRVIMGVGYNAEYVVSSLGVRYNKIDVDYSHEEKPLGTGGAIRNAVEMMRYRQLLVLNGDSFCDVNLADFRNETNKKKTSGVVTVPVDDVSRFGSLAVDDDSRVFGMNEKGKAGPGLINAGIYLFSKETIIKNIAAGASSLENDVFPRLLSEGLFAYKTSGRFIDIGTPESYAKAEETLR